MSGERLATALAPLLADWLPRQGWFAATGELGSVSMGELVPVPSTSGPAVARGLLEAATASGTLTCQVVVALAPAVPDTVPERCILGEVEVDGRALMAYEALADPAAASAYAVAAGAGSTVRVERVVDRPWITIVTTTDRTEIAVYRLVEDGPHPDGEVTAALGVGSPTTTRSPVTTWRPDGLDLAALRTGVRRGPTAAEEAWASAREVLARRCAPEQSPRDLATELGVLGAALAGTHAELAHRFGAETLDGRVLGAFLTARIPAELDEPARQLLGAAYRRLEHADDLGAAVRVHGDLHLECADRARNGWQFSWFGCDPRVPLGLRRLPASPLMDLASLLADIGAVAAGALAEALAERGDVPDSFREQSHRRELAVLAEAWEERCADAVVAGYAANAEVQRLLPVERISRDALMAVFEMERSVRDLVERHRSRDGMLRIPVEEVEAELVSGRSARRGPLRW